MTDEPLSSSTPRSWSWVAKAGLIFLTGCVVLCSGITGWYVVSRGKHQARLNAVLERIRAAGDPLTGDELDAYYVVPADEVDLTADYVAALRMFENVKLFGPATVLPIVDSGEAPKPDQPWETRAEAEAYLQSVQPQLDALRTLATRRGRVRYPVKLSEGFAAQLSDLQLARVIANKLLLSFYVNLHRSDREEALSSLRAIVRLSETFRDEPLTASQLVRISFLETGADAAEDFLHAGRPSAAELALLRDIFADVNLQPAFGRAMRGELSSTYIAMSSGDVTAEQLSPGADSFPLNLTLKTLSKLRPGDAATLLEMQAHVIAIAERPLPEAIRGMDQIRLELKQINVEQQNDFSWDRNLLPQLLIPIIGPISQAFGRGQARRDAILSATAVESFKVQRGSLPETLDELAPAFLDEIPVDPFTGYPLRYVVDERGFSIYSLGPDRVDQGGDLTATLGQPKDLGVRIEPSISTHDSSTFSDSIHP